MLNFTKQANQRGQASPCLYPVINIIKNPAVKKLKITQISQTDGPTDTSDGYTSRSEDESDRDLSMRKTNNQTKRNVKRRKTSRTKEEIEIDQEERKTMLERVEKENTKTAMQKNAQKTKLTKKDKNEEKAPYQEQMDQPPQGRNDKAPPPVILEGKPIIEAMERDKMEEKCKKSISIKYTQDNTLINTECLEDFEAIKELIKNQELIPFSPLSGDMEAFAKSSNYPIPGKVVNLRGNIDISEYHK
ncbi:hypothetical protein JTB14_025509 [Gonioctena quinquepunctata]|nr:hypothetical protein JTB14_025509 [Gonioctena quinquepunctata]